MSQKTLDLIHIKIHALRMMPDYKPSVFEQELNKIIAEEFKSNCKECEDKLKTLNSTPITNKKGFMDKLGGVFE